ncbi:hypothetical protein QBZ16_005163 [Prototheca wickerhamii]|uniref:E1 ubiquitin-activating enzyme n=1 Tax=Prototheca wickerhamii TaxID=3111 RepID=A0AAD9MJR2_PROWI|nr:hypothetical protein QBZ16_005163 [Prototheca wickerhamii]
MTEDTVMANGVDAVPEIDEDLHSRQLAVYGKESMRRMAAASVLIWGLNGLGVEVAKNVILAGVKSVTLADTAAVELRDLGSQFYLTEADVGRNRAEACRDRLQELNSAVLVSAADRALDAALVAGHQVVVAVDVPRRVALEVDAHCHAAGVAFIRADVRGLFASVFCDFGASFSVYDVDGEEPHTGIVAGIAQGPRTLVTCVEDDRLEFQDGELVTFSEVVGMPELAAAGPVRVVNCRPHSLELELDSTGFGAYVRGGIITQHKPPREMAFKTLAQALEEPGEFLLTDFAKMDRPALLHAAFKALDAFAEARGALPGPADAEAFAAEVGAEAEASDEARRVLRLLARGARAVLNPMAAMIGGVVGQEVVKAASGKFTPLHQWLYFDSVESVPEKGEEAESDAAAVEAAAAAAGRYADQVLVFGPEVQRQLGAARVFLVGAGALGCELLKNFALMGVATEQAGGSLTVTDDDTIEKSNLSRQFLFRDWDIGASKSAAAAAAARRINPALAVTPLQNRVSPDTEDVFDDAFWQAQDLIVNALDNVNARLYVDARCVYFGRPLLESGTLGPKANTQSVVPGLTENYGASRDPPEKQAPMCTLHSFPHNIHHCLTYARSEFEGLLEKTPAEANAFLADRAKYLAAARAAGDAAARDQLEKVARVLVAERCASFDDCLAWARRKFQEQFHDRIAQLVHTFPEDARTSTGAPFWSAPKRFPRPLAFDAADAGHAAWAQAAAVLAAEVHGVSVPDWARADAYKCAALAAAVPIEPFAPREGVRIETDPKATGAAPASADEAAIEGAIEALGGVPAGTRPLRPIVFEKDDDTNFHMQFIAGVANMRARNYDIPEVDRLQAKLIAGRIIPAIATTTAMATGLVCLEAYKVFRGAPVEAFRNTFANLALPLFAMAEPVPPKKFKFKDMEWSLWDRWVLEGDLTVRQVLDWFRQRDLEAYSISSGQSLLYNSLFPKHKERMDTKMSELVKTVAKQTIPDNRNHFDVVVACEDEDGEDLDVPLVSIKFR